MRFTTRVELHRAMKDDYEQLHEAMERNGFSRFIESSDGITYQLPTAEYNYDGDTSKEDVLERAKRAAETTGLAYAVLVTESNGRKWHNLPKAS